MPQDYPPPPGAHPPPPPGGSGGGAPDPVGWPDPPQLARPQGPWWAQGLGTGRRWVLGRTPSCGRGARAAAGHGGRSAPCAGTPVVGRPRRSGSRRGACCLTRDCGRTRLAPGRALSPGPARPAARGAGGCREGGTGPPDRGGGRRGWRSSGGVGATGRRIVAWESASWPQRGPAGRQGQEQEVLRRHPRRQCGGTGAGEAQPPLPLAQRTLWQYLTGCRRQGSGCHCQPALHGAPPGPHPQ
mmetsp:Transcript_41615/g.74692  ORF Transcript_41615/g.74692 Transcript_41615/m.74692 type:complete len:242 (+) Transcript_41615:708-1433(+)